MKYEVVDNPNVRVGDPNPWAIVDMEGFIVCTCSKRWNALLICKLLNQHT